MRATFFYDLASPECYLAAERVNHGLPEVPVWQPVRPECRRVAPPAADERAELDRRAATQGLPPLRLPEPWPENADLALRAAVFAQASGRVVAFSLAALRQAFAGGRDLSDVDNVLVAAAACELHPRAVLKGVESRATAERLRAASERARAMGVRRVPAVVVGDRVFEGAEAPEEAAAASSAG